MTKCVTICSMHSASQLSKPDAIKHAKSEELMTVSDVCSILWERGNTFCPLLYLQWAFHRLARITIPLTNRVFCGQARPDVRFEDTEILLESNEVTSLQGTRGISRSQKALPWCGASLNIPEQAQVIKSALYFGLLVRVRERWRSCTSLCICNRNDSIARITIPLANSSLRGQARPDVRRGLPKSKFSFSYICYHIVHEQNWQVRMTDYRNWKFKRLLLSGGLVLQQPATGAACAPELIKSYGRMALGPTWPSLSWKQWGYRREWLKPKGDNSSKENLKYAFCSPFRYCMCLKGGVSQSYMWYSFLD